MMTVAIVIGMIAATFENEKEVKLTLEENKLNYNYYSPFSYEGIVVDQASKLVLVTENGNTLTLSANDEIKNHNGYASESITVSFELSECEAELLEDKKVVEVNLQHANGVEYHLLKT